MKHIIFFVFFAVILLANAQDTIVDEIQKEVAQEQTAPHQKTYIEMSAVPTAALQTQTQIDAIFKELETQKKEIAEITKHLMASKHEVDILLSDEINNYLDKLNTKILQKKYNTLEAYLIQLKEINTQFNERMQEYKKALEKIENLHKLWEETLQEAIKQKAPDAVINNISNVVSKISSSQEKLQKDFDATLTLINTISIYILKIQKLQEKILEAQDKIANNLFQQNELPYHIMFAEQEFQLTPYLKNIGKNIQDNFEEFQKYLFIYNERLWVFFLVMGVLGSFIWYFNYLYRKQKLFIQKESLRKKSFFFLKRPFSTFLILMAFSNLFIFPDMSQVVKNTELLFIIIPIFRIVATVTPEYALRHLHIFFVLYVVFVFNKDAIDSTLMSRTMTIILALGLIALIIRVLRIRLFHNVFTPLNAKIINRILFFVIVLLSGAVGANLYGASNLSNRLLDAAYTIVFSGLLFYTLALIFTGYTIVLLRRHMATATNLIEEFAIKVEKNTTLFIKVIMTIWWLKVAIDALGIYDYLQEITNSFLAISFKISNFSISVQSIIDFLLIIVITWFLARFITTLLEVEVFSRYKFPRGVPTAIKTLLNYIIIFIGALVALSALGISAEQFTVVFGALGVGIGFGLRNIIANFISGIIMVFERPVQIGDIIQVDKTLGEVKTIGARSTTIATYDGSEVIIPNADFISKEITNWTFSSDKRRKSLAFKVDLGSDIQQILAIIEHVALQQPNVLHDPKPLATFQGFGEYYLEFKLYFWLDKQLMVTQSEVAQAVYEALMEAGVKMPVPKQQQIR
jgi:small-conductance mechanosensitive channel